MLIDLEDLSLSHIKHILRTVQQDKLSFYKEILCDPTSRRFCSFIDDDYLKKRNYLDVHIIGLTASFPAFSSSFNYVKDLNIVATSLTQTNCQNFYKILPSINPLQITDTEELISKLQSLYKKIADAECEISKIFPLQIPCPNRLKFIHQINDYGLDYICGENLEDLKKNLTKEETIPIKRDFYIYAKITQNPLDKLDFDLDKIKELNFYFMAYWIRFPIQKILNKNKKVFYFVVSVYIRINAHHFNFIGLPDSYSQASCIDLNANYDRYVSPKGSSFGRDTFLFKHEQAFFNAIKPKKLELFQEKYNLGSVETNYWKIFLKKTQCEFARIWIPILWKGDGASACNNVFSGFLFIFIKFKLFN